MWGAMNGIEGDAQGIRGTGSPPLPLSLTMPFTTFFYKISNPPSLFTILVLQRIPIISFSRNKIKKRQIDRIILSKII